MSPRQAAIAVIAAVLCGCGLGAAFDRATAGPAVAVEQPGPPPAATEPFGRAYFFRGFAGWVFSRGIDQLAERIGKAGYATVVNEAWACPNVAKDAIRDYRENPATIAVFGHSVGAACAIGFARMLNAENIPVKLLVTTDPAKISQEVPLNVERYINIFQSDSMLGGRDVKPAPGFQGHYASFDLVEHKEITHLNMEKEDFIHDQLVSKVRDLAATPANGEGERVQLRYVVPADAALELWDSGMAVFAQAGDTLQSLAALYGVPLWSLSQINRVADGKQLAAGQRIVVPRHLVPPATPGNGTAAGETPAKP
jgi:LysM domain-containing protein